VSDRSVTCSWLPLRIAARELSDREEVVRSRILAGRPTSACMTFSVSDCEAGWHAETFPIKAHPESKVWPEHFCNVMGWKGTLRRRP